MAVDHTIYVPKAKDHAVLAFLRDAAGILGADNIRYQLAGASREVSLSTTNDDIEKYTSSISDRYAIYNGTVRITNFDLVYTREPTDRTGIVFDSIRTRNTGRDVHPQQEPIQPEQFVQLNELIDSTFGANVEQSAALFRDPKAFREVMRSHQSMIERLEETVLQVGENAAAARSKLEDEYWKKNSDLARKYDERKDTLEAEASSARDEIRQQQAELDQTKRDLDDRNNTHARRELHRDLKTRIAQRADSLKVTPETTANRRPIHIASSVFSLALLALIVVFTIQLGNIPENSPVSVYLVAGLKPVSLSIALLGLMAWYLRWINRWFERYADTEFQLKQFELDIDRASWVVEAALEWKLSQDRPMPEHLLETISRNLFSKSDRDESADMHPADYLASAILGRASALNLKVPGGEISLTGRDIKRLQKDDVAAS